MYQSDVCRTTIRRLDPCIFFIEYSQASATETEFITWAKGLISENHLPEAIEVLKLNTSLNPNSADALVELGRAYEKSSLKVLAVASYRKAIQKNPGNDIAKSRLEKLE